MTFRKTSFVLLLTLPFAAPADFVASRYYYNPQTTVNTISSQKATMPDYVQALQYSASTLPVRFDSSRNVLICQDISSRLCYSNDVTGVTMLMSANHFYKRNLNLLDLVSTSVQLGYISTDQLLSCAPYIQGGSVYYFRFFDVASFCENVFKNFTASQLLTIAASVPVIQSDVSALLPLVESNKNINAGIALDFKDAAANAQYQRSEIVNDLTTIINNRLFGYTVHYDIPQIRDDIRALVSVNPSASCSDNNALVLEYFDLLGFDYSQDQSALVDAMINSGLANSNNDALAKLSSTFWRRNTLGPYVQVQRKKRDLIAQLRQAGITHNFDGRALDALANPELETLLQFSFNTPVSSNATLQAHSLDALKNQNELTVENGWKLDDVNDALRGPLQVNVMNWPDNWLGNSISNAFDGLFSGLLEGVTNFNPHYNFDDEIFFGRNLYSWRGFGQSALDQTEQNPVERDTAIGVTSFEFNPTGDFFQDVPNLLAMQSMQGADLANIFATVAIHVQSNAQEMANTDALVDQYQEDLAQAAAEALDDFQSMMHYSNLLSNVQFTDTQDLLELPDGFRVFSGDWQVPEYVNIELPTWDFQQPGTDGNNPPTRDQVNPGHTITIDTTQYRSFFQNVRYASLVLYWGLLICFVLVLFRIFRAFIGIIPKTLTGNADSSYTA